MQNSTDVINKKVLHKPEYVSYFRFFRAAPFRFDDSTTHPGHLVCQPQSPRSSARGAEHSLAHCSSQTVSNVTKSQIIKHILVCFTHFFFVGHIIPYVFCQCSSTVRKIIKWRKYKEWEGVWYTFDWYCTCLSKHVCEYVYIWV